MLDDLGLIGTLRSLLDRQAQSVKFSLSFELGSISLILSPEIETACFRVVQEAITNVVRHARASHARVEFWQEEADLRLMICDDGVGFDVAAARRRAVCGESLGLFGIEERVTLLGGLSDINSAPNHGTVVRVRLPIHLAG